VEDVSVTRDYDREEGRDNRLDVVYRLLLDDEDDLLSLLDGGDDPDGRELTEEN